jgi:uncharacterized membrane protein
MKNIPTWIVVLLIGFSFLGFLDASYLTIKQYQGDIVPCSITEGCDAVLASAQSKILGIPVSRYGVVYYLAILLLSIASLHNRNILRWVVYIPFTGLAFSAWFMYAQIVIIHALCQYCIASAIITLQLCFISMRMIQLDHEQIS